jgi:hypothetical protein
VMKSRRFMNALQPGHSLPYCQTGGVLCITAKTGRRCLNRVDAVEKGLEISNEQ